MTIKYCPNCGTTNSIGAMQCVRCGAILSRIQQPVMQPQSAQQATQRLQRPGKSTSKKPIVISAVIAIIVVAILSALVVFSGVIGGDSQATPEGAVNSLASAINNHDAKALLDCTTMHFLSPSNYSLALSYLQGSSFMDSSVHVTMTNVTVTYYALMTTSQKQLVSQAESGLIAMGVTATVQDSCIVSATATMTGTGSSGGSDTSQIVALKIDGRWYLSMPSIDDYRQTPAAFGIAKGSTATEWTFKLIVISGDSSVLKSDVYVAVKDATGNMIISAVQLGTATGTDGFNYTSVSGGLYISVGDVFSLDRTIYAVGSTLMLISVDGMYTYLAITV